MMSSKPSPLASPSPMTALPYRLVEKEEKEVPSIVTSAVVSNVLAVVPPWNSRIAPPPATAPGLPTTRSSTPSPLTSPAHWVRGESMLAEASLDSTTLVPPVAVRVPP